MFDGGVIDIDWHRVKGVGLYRMRFRAKSGKAVEPVWHRALDNRKPGGRMPGSVEYAVLAATDKLNWHLKIVPR